MVTPYGPDGTGRHTDRPRPHGPLSFTAYARVDTLSHVNQQTVRAPLHHFSVPLSATRRGARLARLLAAEQLGDWGLPLDPARLVVAELAANAVLHGRVPGRSFRLTLSFDASGTLRVEIADACGERLPTVPGGRAEAMAECGYGLLLVQELADRWGVRSGPVPCKTVWAELDVSRPLPEPGNT